MPHRIARRCRRRSRVSEPWRASRSKFSPRTIWTQLRGWPKEVAHAVYQPFILAMQVATLAAAGFVRFDPASLVLIVAALPALLAGAWLGWLAFGRFDERRFRQVLTLMIAVSGAMLMV
jgi:hypothetical protein